jgi:hypothetical protein
VSPVRYELDFSISEDDILQILLSGSEFQKIIPH